MLKSTARRNRTAARRMREEGIDPKFRHSWRYLCGTLYEMPIEPTMDELLQAAELAVEHAQACRKYHARRSKRGEKQRAADIELTLDKLAKAMRPLRRKLARLPYDHVNETTEQQIRDASAALQRERRKLWKMNRPIKRRN